MFLFIISFILVFISSYLISSVLSPRKNILGFIYLLLTAFAQILLTFEILSLFVAIKQFWVIGFNILFLILSIFIWNKKSRPLWTVDFRGFINKVINAFKLDKALVWLFAGFCIFIFSALFLCFIMPITNCDAQGYHVVRSVFWVLQGSLNHFDVSDMRNLTLPINSEILYSWILLFVKKDLFLGFFSFSGYLLAIISIYNILGLLGYCTRRKLWVIFILSSFSSVIVQVSGTETDIIIAGLVSASIFLFWYGLKNNEKAPVLMSSLAYAIAIGTKTTAILTIPGVALLLLFLCFKFKKYKPLSYFLGFGVINFLIFSSYNYILNFIDFHNFMGSKSFIIVHKNYFGIKGMSSNFIKYLFMFFDFTGFKWGLYLNGFLSHMENLTLSFFHLISIKNGLYSAAKPHFESTLLEPVMGAGVLGLLVFPPCLLWALIKPVFKPKSQKTLLLFVFALIFILNLFSISYSIAYMSYSIRFIMSFIVLSSPILVYSYFPKKNLFKGIIIFFALFYLIFVSTYLWPRPFVKIVRILREGHSITYLREVAICKDFEKNPLPTNSSCFLTRKIRGFKKNTKVLVFSDAFENIYLLKALEFEGYKVDFRNMEDITGIDFSKYNLVVFSNAGQVSTVIKNYDGLIKVHGPVSCKYISNPLLSSIKGEESYYPYQVACNMSDKFLKQNHLEMIGRAGVIKPSLGEFSYYVIYRNTKLPLEFKKRI